MRNGTTSRGACMAAATLILLGIIGARPAAAGEAVLEARALPPVLATDMVNLRALPASAAVLDPGIYLERTESYNSESEQVLPFEPRNRGAMLVGRTRRLAIFADDVTRAVALASPRGWGVVIGYEASRVEEGRSSEERSLTEESSSRIDSWETATDERFQFGAGWRLGSEKTRLYEIGVLGSWFDSRGSHMTAWQHDTLDVRVNRTATRRQDLGVGLTLRTLSSREGLQLGFSLLYEDPRPSFHHTPRLHQRRREARLDGAWRVAGSRLDDLLVGVSLLWSDQSTLIATTDHDGRSASEQQETLYAGMAFVSVEESIIPGLVLRAGARAPARIGAKRERRLPVYADGGYGPLGGWKEAEGSVREAEVAVGLGGRWRRFRVDGQLKSTLGLDDPVLRWSLTASL